MEQNKAQRDLELDAMYNMASKFMNYEGPRTRKAMLEFANSSPAIAAKMGQYQQTMKGMLQKKPVGMNQGGFSYDQDVVPKFGDTVSATMAATDPKDTQATITEDPNQIIAQAGDVTGTDPSYTATQGTVDQQVKLLATFYCYTASTMQAGQMQLQVFSSVQGAMNAAQYQTQVGQAAQVASSTQISQLLLDYKLLKVLHSMMEPCIKREIQLVNLYLVLLDALQLDQFTEQIQAASATPLEKATVLVN